MRLYAAFGETPFVHATTPRALSALALVLAGCASTRTSHPPADVYGPEQTVSTQERAILSLLPALGAGVEKQIDGATVVPGAPYDAASGRICRPIRVTVRGVPPRTRLACAEGEHWFFAPDVLMRGADLG